MKVCNKCEEEKELEEFSLDRSRKDERQPVCKKCNNRYWLENKDEIMRKHAEYNRTHRAETNARKNAWYQRNKEEINRKDRERYQKNLEKNREKKREWYHRNKGKKND